MKKVLLPLLMLIVASSFLMAVESSPSAIVGYVKYPCVTGTNLIALPMDTGATMSSSTIGLANPILNSMATWEAAQFWNGSQAYDNGDGTFTWDPDFEYTTGTGLMVFATDNFNFYSMGSVPAPPVYALVEGTNMIMVPLNKSNLSDTQLLGETSVNFNSIALWDAGQYWNGSQAYDNGDGTFTWDPVISTPIGTPLMVYSTTAFTWPSSKGVSNTPNVHSSKKTK